MLTLVKDIILFDKFIQYFKKDNSEKLLKVDTNTLYRKKLNATI